MHGDRDRVKTLLWVAAGGACGAVLRYGVQTWAANAALPWGTFFANVLGSLAIGGLIGAFAGAPWFETIGRAFLVAGLLGAFTTFSAFSADALLLWEQGRYRWCVAYVAGSVAMSLGAAYAGYRLAGALA